MGSTKKRAQYSYDAVGNRIGMVDPDGGRITYAYDSMGRTTSVVNPQGERTSYSYDANGRQTLKQLANGTRASFTYDDASQLTVLGNLKSDGSVISQFDYSYDKAGNRTAVAEADGSRVTWLYDDTYQLTGEHRTGSTPFRNTFTYDSAGNRTLKNEAGTRTTYAYDPANQLRYGETAGGRTTYTYDADGNQQLVTAPNNDRTTTLWDYENKATEVQLPSGIRNTMSYEPDGLRVKLEDSTGTKKFIWDDQNYLAETDENNDTQAVYTNEPAYYGNLISQRRESNTSYYHYEALGSTRELTDATEAITDTYLYDAWGVPLATVGATINPFRYVGNVGYYFDADTQDNYIRARIYRPTIGRWLSVDPLGTFSHQYSYSSNFPILFLDPSGEIEVISGNTGYARSKLDGPCTIPRPGGNRNSTNYRKGTGNFVVTETSWQKERMRRDFGSRTATLRNIYNLSLVFVQKVSIHVELILGSNTGPVNCNTNICPCVTSKLTYTASFIELFGKGSDQNNINSFPVFDELLADTCKANGTTLNINPCCEWSYKSTVTKTVTLTPGNEGHSKYDVSGKEMVVDCNGVKGKSANISLSGAEVIDPPNAGKILKRRNERPIYPSPLLDGTDSWQTVNTLSITHAKCGDVIIEFNYPGYKRVQ